MFGIGPLELIVIAVFAIIFIGPKNLPEMMGKVAKFFVKAKRYSSDIKYGIDDMVRKAEDEVRVADLEKDIEKELKNVSDEAKKLTAESSISSSDLTDQNGVLETNINADFDEPKQPKKEENTSNKNLT